MHSAEDDRILTNACKLVCYTRKILNEKLPEFMISTDGRLLMSEEKKDFVVKDRRRFSQESQEGESKDQQAETAAAEDVEKKQSSSDAQRRRSETRDKPHTPEEEAQTLLPEINFATFVVSLNASALLHLGAIEDPATGQANKNLPMAKQTIDILCMLEQKTAGNLSKDEENLLKNILYDLRIIYVKESG